MLLPWLLLLAQAAQAHDWIIEPGLRVGPVYAKSTENELRAAFGKGAVVTRVTELGEGVTGPAMIVYPNDPTRRLAIVFRNNRPSLILICHEQRSGPCRWKTRDGIGFRTTVVELERRNGGPFEINSLFWRTRWKGGLLIGFHTDLSRLSLPERAAFSGDKVFSSNDPRLSSFHLTVAELSLEFPLQP